MTDQDVRTADDNEVQGDEDRLDAGGNLQGDAEFQNNRGRLNADLTDPEGTNDGPNDSERRFDGERGSFRRQISNLRDRLDRLHDRLNEHVRDGLDRDFDRDRFGRDDDFARGDGSGRWSDFLDTLGLEFSADADGQLTIGDLADSSLAARLQLRPGDTILTVNGQAVDSPRELARALSNLRARAWLEFDVLRDGQTRSIRAQWTADMAMAVRPGNRNPNQAWSVDADRLESLGFSFSGDASGQLTLGDIANTSVAATLRLQTGDTITAVNGQPVETLEEFVAAFDGLHPGSRLELEVNRDGDRRLIRTTLQPAFFRDTGADSSTRRSSDASIAGFGADFSTDANGMLTIDNVVSSGFAGRLGLQQGDVLLSVNGREVTSADQLQAQAGDPQAAGSIRVLRDGRIVTLRSAARLVPPGVERSDGADSSATGVRSDDPSTLPPGVRRQDEDSSP